jgi:uncharacterized protein (TIRG00374 family)
VKKQWKLWVGLAISVVALALVIRNIDPHEVADTLTQAEYFYLIPATVGILAYLLARSIRWRIMLPGVSLYHCFWITNIGYLVSNVLPFRLGDPARAVVVGRGEEVSTSAALSTVVVERVLDMLMVVALLAVVAPFAGEAGSAMRSNGLIAGMLALAASAVLLFFAFRPDWGRRMARRMLGWVPWLNEERWLGLLDGLLEGLASLRSGRHGLALLAWSGVTWALVVAFYWALIRAFVPQPPVSMAAFAVVGAGLGMAVPSSPGAMGVFHGVIFYVLTEFFAVPTGLAGTVAFAIHTFQYVLGCLLGLVGLAREGLSLGWVRAQAASVEEAE